MPPVPPVPPKDTWDDSLDMEGADAVAPFFLGAIKGDDEETGV
jgi:hypothetical protein